MRHSRRSTSKPVFVYGFHLLARVMRLSVKHASSAVLLAAVRVVLPPLLAMLAVNSHRKASHVMSFGMSMSPGSSLSGLPAVAKLREAMALLGVCIGNTSGARAPNGARHTS